MSVITVAGNGRPGEPDTAASGGQTAGCLRRDCIGVGFFNSFIVMSMVAFISWFRKKFSLVCFVHGQD